MQALGKLKEWRRAVDGHDKPRPFGFAIFEDAESTDKAFRMLEELSIPSLQSNKKPTKLIVCTSCRITDRCSYCPRFELTRTPWTIFQRWAPPKTRQIQ
jgi:hypothetical protein